jgi:hypothetical protein
MTEAEWLAATDFWPMHEHLWDVARSRPRKYRLVSCAICRLICQDHPDKRIHRLLDLAEAFADDPSAEEALRNSLGAVEDALGAERSMMWAACDTEVEDYDTNEVARLVSFAQDRESDRWTEEHPEVRGEERDAGIRHAILRANSAGAIYIHEVFGNPFRPVTLPPAWRTPDVTALATAIYEERAFDRLPILADALEDAGCTDAAILDHCRGPGPHVRGCWVVDLILGKE